MTEMVEIEIQNKINFRNIAVFFVIGIIGTINGLRDFFLYQTPIAKVIFPDPVVYNNIVNLNNNMINSMTVENSMSFGGSMLVLAVFIIVVVMLLGMTAGVMGKGD